MAVPKSDFYTLSGMNRTDIAPRSFKYDPADSAWAFSIFVPPNNPFQFGTSDEILQGEMVALVNGLLETSAVVRWNGDFFNLTFLGIARDSAREYKRTWRRAPTSISVFTGGIHMLRSTPGETYYNAAVVKMNTSTNDTDQIRLGGSAAEAVGRVLLPPDNVDHIDGDGKVRVPILIDTVLR
jgi:hypothetical protein